MNRRNRVAFAPRLSASIFLSSASLLALLPVAAHAQSVPGAESAAEVDPALESAEIVVSASALQDRAEINARQQATGIVDTLSSDEIGALPDITVADSLRRITGVTTIFNDDIGQFASIRGVHPDFLPVTINGLAVATTGDLGEGTRKVNLQVIPGDAVLQLQAFKTPSPDLDAGSLGGLINIDTISAFDAGRSAFSVTGGISYSSYMDVPDTNAAGDRKNSPFGKSFSARWTPRFGRVGLAVTAMYDQRTRTQSNSAIANRNYFNAAGAATTPEAADWNGFAAPDSFVSHNYTNKFEKYGGTARLEFEVNERFTTGLFGYAYFSNEQETRNTNRLYGLDLAQDQTADTGTERVKSSDVQWRYNTFQRDQRGLQWKNDLELSDKARLSTNIGYSHAWFASERPYAVFVYKPGTRLSYNLTKPDALFTVSNPTAYVTGSNYKLNTIYRDWRESTEDIFEGRVDFSYNNGNHDRGLGFAAGVDVRDIDLKRDNSAIYYKAGAVSLQGLSFVPDFALPGYSMPGLWLDQKAFWNNVVPTLAIDTATSDIQSRLNDYRYRETVYAGYANANYTTDAFRADIGLRLDRTDFSAEMPKLIDGVLQSSLITKQGGQTRLLPYFTGRYSLTPNLRIKAGASQTMGRPNPESIAAAEQLDEAALTITRGNPDIKPLRSTNLDLGIEGYFNAGRGMVTATVFRKSIRDDIIALSSRELVGDDYYTVTQPINGEKTRYQGIELGLVNASFGNVAPWLAKFGASANATWIGGTTGYVYKGEQRVRHNLQYQADFAANVAVFYAFSGGTELRVAMNHQGRYLEEFAGNPWQEISIAPFTTYDVTARIALTDRIQLRLEGRNIFSANRNRLTGPTADYARAELEVGSTWFARLNFRL